MRSRDKKKIRQVVDRMPLPALHSREEMGARAARERDETTRLLSSLA